MTSSGDLFTSRPITTFFLEDGLSRLSPEPRESNLFVRVWEELVRDRMRIDEMQIQK